MLSDLSGVWIETDITQEFCGADPGMRCYLDFRLQHASAYTARSRGQSHSVRAALVGESKKQYRAPTVLAIEQSAPFASGDGWQDIT
jgi:hypothetical protein